MKPTRSLFAFIIGSMFFTQMAHAQLYWDSNAAVAGAGTTPTGTWGTSNFWNTNSAGGAGTFSTATVNTDNLVFVAGPGATSGNTAYNVDVNGAQAANSLTFQASGGTTIRNGTSVTLGNGTPATGGITMSQFAYGATAQGAVTISTALILNNTQTWTNNSANALTISGGLNNGGNTLTIDGTGTTTFGNTTPFITGAGGITKNGSGQLILSGAGTAPAHNYSGTTTINGGSILIQNGNNSTGTGNVTLNGGVLQGYFGNSYTRALGAGAGAIQIIGGVSGFSGQGGTGTTFTSGTNITWGSAFFAPTEFVLQTSTANANSGSSTFTSNLELDGANRTIRSDQNNSTFGGGGTFSGNITGAAAGSALTKTGVGMHTLTGTNTYVGGTSINQGTLRFNTRASMPASGNVSVASGATLGVTVASSGTTWGGGLGNAGIAGLTAGLGGQPGSTVSFSGNSNLLLNVTATTTESNAITNGGATNLSLIKIGAGQLNLNGANSYTGATTVTVGTLATNNVAAAGANSGIGAYAGTDNAGLVLNGGTFSYTGATDGTTNRGFQTTAASTLNVATAGVKLTMGEYKPTVDNMALTVTGGTGSSLVLDKVTVSPGIRAAVNSASTPVRVNTVSFLSSTTSRFQFFNNITVGDVTNNGTNAAIQFGGNSGVAITIDGAVSLGSGQFNTVQNSSKTTFIGTSFAAGSIQVAGSGALGSSGFIVGGSSQLGAGGTYAGGISSNSGNLFQYNSSANQLLSGDLTGSLNVFMTGTGTLTLSGTNVYTGNTTVTNGILTTTKAASQAGYTTPGKVVVNGGTLGVQVGGAGWSDAQVNTMLTNATKTSGALGIDTTNGNFTQATAYTSTNLGGLGLTKLGANNLILGLTNTYAGATTVNAGTLLVNGSTDAGSTVSVSAGATLGGTGTIGGAVNVTGQLSPGALIETLGTGTLSMANTSTLVHELDSSVSTSVGSDLLKVTGNLNLAGTVNLTLSDLALTDVAFAPSTTFSLINYTGAWNNGLFTFGGNELTDEEVFAFGLNTWKISYNDPDGGLNYLGEYAGGSDSFVNLTAVPEPGAALLGSLGLLMIMRRRR